jgi:hypothetical protein
VGPGEPAALTADVTVTVRGLTAVSVGAQGPGEVAGPGVRVDLEVRNDSSEPFDLGTLAVNASTDGTPAIPSDSAPAKALSGQLVRGRTATGVYVFTVPKGAEDDLRVDVSSSSAADVVVFEKP